MFSVIPLDSDRLSWGEKEGMKLAPRSCIWVSLIGAYPSLAMLGGGDKKAENN